MRYIIETKTQFIETFASSEAAARHIVLNAFPFMPESAIKWIYHADKPVTGHRKPTKAEVNRGYGATHYKDFDFFAWVRPTKQGGGLKKWIVCQYDGLRYYR
jgi:hypothetical protein